LYAVNRGNLVFKKTKEQIMKKMVRVIVTGFGVIGMVALTGYMSGGVAMAHEVMEMVAHKTEYHGLCSKCGNEWTSSTKPSKCPSCGNVGIVINEVSK
jgi:hypothetical protein